MTKPLFIANAAQIDEELSKVRRAAADAHTWIAAQSGNPMAFLRSVKFEKRGYHPIDGHALNLIEQVNQTWTYAVAFAATQFLFEKHPESGGFHLAPGATMSQELDIMSEVPNLVGAETFAATTPRSNGKLNNDMKKMCLYPHVKHRYIFFASPGYGHCNQHAKFEKDGVQVWSVEV